MRLLFFSFYHSFLSLKYKLSLWVFLIKVLFPILRPSFNYFFCQQLISLRPG